MNQRSKKPQKVGMDEQAFRERLCERYADYIGNLARKLWRRLPVSAHMEIEDLKQFGYMALLQLIDRIDWNNRNTREIDNYIRRRLYGGMMDGVRTNDNQWSTRIRKDNNKPLFVDIESLNQEQLSHSVPTIDQIQVICFLNTLDYRERIITLFALQGFKNVEIAAELPKYGFNKYTESRISQIITKVIGNQL